MPSGMRPCLHLLTGEYPPTLGGVADNTRLIAMEVARAGAEVHVWYPASDDTAPVDAGVTLHAIPGGFSARSLRPLAQALGREDMRSRLLVQWVPHAFGWRSMNVGLVLWLASRAWTQGVPLDIVVHEAGLGWSGGIVHRLVSLVHQAMAATLVHAARRIWVSIPAWEARWRPLALGRARDFRLLPMPNLIPTVGTTADAATLRARLGVGTAPLVVHFGTYGAHHLPQLEGVFGAILARDGHCRLVLVGPGGDRLRARITSSHPGHASRVIVTGALEASAVSAIFVAADVVVQPFTDGISGRRSSAMAPLAHGCAMVSTWGVLSEPFWRDSPGVVLAPADDPIGVAEAALRLLHDESARQGVQAAALALYDARFHVRHAVAALLAPDTA